MKIYQTTGNSRLIETQVGTKESGFDFSVFSRLDAFQYWAGAFCFVVEGAPTPYIYYCPGYDGC